MSIAQWISDWKNWRRVLKQILGQTFCQRKSLKIWSVKTTIYSLKYNYNQLQKLWQKLLFGQCFASPPLFPLLAMLRLSEQNLCQAMLWVCKIVKRERGNFQTDFLKFPCLVTGCLKLKNWEKESWGISNAVSNMTCCLESLLSALMSLIMSCTIGQSDKKWSNNDF